MDLENSFEIASPAQDVWDVLKNIEDVVPCLPGAQLLEVKGDEFHGNVKVKVGPITSQYKGVVTFVECDDAKKKLVLDAKGRDTKGAGNANAVITVQLEDAGGSKTKVSVATNLSVTGKVAQFGRGVLADISANIMKQFGENLSSLLAGGGAGRAGSANSAGDKEDKAGGAAGEAEEEKAEALAGQAQDSGKEPEAVDITASVSSKGTKVMLLIAGFFLKIYANIKNFFVLIKSLLKRNPGSGDSSGSSNPSGDS